MSEDYQHTREELLGLIETEEDNIENYQDIIDEFYGYQDQARDEIAKLKKKLEDSE